MDQSQLSLFAQIYDSYLLVDALAAHPRIDPSHIAGLLARGFAALYTKHKTTVAVAVDPVLQHTGRRRRLH